MADRVTREELAQTAPDPEQDFAGFMQALCDAVLKDIDAEMPAESEVEAARWFLMRSLSRALHGLERGHPWSLQRMYLAGVLRCTRRYQRLMEEQP